MRFRKMIFGSGAGPAGSGDSVFGKREKKKSAWMSMESSEPDPNPFVKFPKASGRKDASSANRYTNGMNGGGGWSSSFAGKNGGQNTFQQDASVFGENYSRQRRKGENGGRLSSFCSTNTTMGGGHTSTTPLSPSSSFGHNSSNGGGGRSGSSSSSSSSSSSNSSTTPLNGGRDYGGYSPISHRTNNNTSAALIGGIAALNVGYSYGGYTITSTTPPSTNSSSSRPIQPPPDSIRLDIQNGSIYSSAASYYSR